MLRFIERLREKPESVRRRYAVIISIAFVALVALGTFGNILLGHNQHSDLIIDDTPSPLHAITENIKDSIAAAKESISKSNPFKSAPTEPIAPSPKATSTATTSQNSVIITDTP